MVAKVLPSKSDGTVGLGPRSSPVKLRSDPVSVMTDADADADAEAEDEESELLWPAVRPASHTSERIAPFMIVTGVEHSPDFLF